MLDAPPGALIRWPALVDHDKWRRLIAARDAATAAARQSLLPTIAANVQAVDLAGVQTYLGTPDRAHRTADTHVLLEFHGGAFVFGGGDVNVRFQAASMATRTGRACYSVDYARPPDAPFPVALEQGVSAYQALLHRHQANTIIISGISAGGNIATALTARIIAQALPPPAALILLTPELDLTESGDSFQTLRGIDRVLNGSLLQPSLLYAGDHALDGPEVSPLFGSVRGFPPTFLQAGTRDLFLSNAVLQHRKLCTENVRCELHIWDAMPHGGFGGFTDEDREIDLAMMKFIDRLR